ncbi:MAG: hypothetical protein JWN01_1240 [Patescibacteria group bacterium]|nr:hypothetical protein [Patescibacteria group bacterium]
MVVSPERPSNRLTIGPWANAQGPSAIMLYLASLSMALPNAHKFIAPSRRPIAWNSQ